MSSPARRFAARLQRALAAAEAALLGPVRAALRAWLGAVRTAVLGDPGTPPATGSFPTGAEWDRIVGAHVADPAAAVFAAAWDAAAADLPPGTLRDTVANSRDAAIRAYAETIPNRLAGVPGETFALLSSRIGAAVTRGATNEEMRNEVADTLNLRSVYGKAQWEWRALRIARTEAGAAVNGGEHLQWTARRAAGGIARLRKQWLATSDYRVRPEHARANGQVVDWDAHFRIGGYPMLHPGDPTAPAGLVVNCRCLLVPLVDDDEPLDLAPIGDPDDPPDTGPAVLAGGTPMTTTPPPYRPAMSLTWQGTGAPVVPAPAARTAAAAPPAPAAPAPAAAPGGTDTPAGAPAALPTGWRGILAPLGVESGDQRVIADPGPGMRSRPFPLPLLAQEALSGFGHEGAVSAGNIDRAWIEGGMLMGEGPFNLSDPEGVAWAARVADGFASGVSVDLDDVVVSEHFFDAATGEELDPETAIDIMWGSPEGEGQIRYQMRVDDWRLMGATVVYQPAFWQAQIEPVYDYVMTGDVPDYPVDRPAPPAGTVTAGENPFPTKDAKDTGDGSGYTPATGDKVTISGGPNDGATGVVTAVDTAAETADVTLDDGGDTVTVAWAKLSKTQASGSAASVEACHESPPRPSAASTAASTSTGAAAAPGAYAATASTNAAGAVNLSPTSSAPTAATSSRPAADTATRSAATPARTPATTASPTNGRAAAGPTTRPGAASRTTRSSGPAGPTSGAAANTPASNASSSASTGSNGNTSRRSLPSRTTGARSADGTSSSAPGREQRPTPTSTTATTRASSADGSAPRVTGASARSTTTPRFSPRPAATSPTGQPASTFRVMSPPATARDALLAAAAPLSPPVEWFAPPNLDGPTPLTITDEGRVFGTLAAWGTCHIGSADMCITAPRTARDYQLFHVGEILLADGSSLSVGKITVGGGHADPHAGPAAAMEHYDDAGAAVAVVRAYEDRHGIQVAGALCAEATPEQVAALRRSPLSGDWRRIGGSLELVAALAVNTPGFPVPRPRAAAGGLGQTSLVAAGVLPSAGREELAAAAVPGRPAGYQLSASLARSLRRGRVEQLTARVAATAATPDGWGVTRARLAALDPESGVYRLVLAAARRAGYPG